MIKIRGLLGKLKKIIKHSQVRLPRASKIKNQGEYNMNNSFKPNLSSRKFRITASIATLSILLLVGVAVAQSYRTLNRTDFLNKENDVLVEQIKKSSDFLLAIQQDDDAPLKILEAKVKEISPADYEKLTSEKSDFQTVISAPEVKMVNVSDKTIKRVNLNIHDHVAKHGKGLMMRELTIRPGESFSIVPGNFVKGQTITSVDENGKLATSTAEIVKEKKYWLPFPSKATLVVRVSVEFEDGSSWYNKNEGGEKK
jgi:hypothetical protein